MKKIIAATITVAMSMLVLSNAEAGESTDIISQTNEYNLIESYTVNKGSKLKSTINNWSERNGYSLNWNVLSESGDVIDWDIKADITIEGDYISSTSVLLETYKTNLNGVNFSWRFYKNKVLLVWLED